MSSDTLASKVFQVGYVVPDLTAAMAFFKEKMGVPRFLEIRNVGTTDQTYRGKPAELRHSIAFGYLGDLQIELIEPISGKSTYTEFLERNPNGGVQHLGIRVADFDAACADMKAKGYDLVQGARNGNTRIAYFDTDRSIGALTEILYLDPAEWEHFEHLRKGEV